MCLISLISCASETSAKTVSIDMFNGFVAKIHPSSLHSLRLPKRINNNVLEQRGFLFLIPRGTHIHIEVSHYIFMCRPWSLLTCYTHRCVWMDTCAPSRLLAWSQKFDCAVDTQSQHTARPSERILSVLSSDLAWTRGSWDQMERMICRNL